MSRLTEDACADLTAQAFPVHNRSRDADALTAVESFTEDSLAGWQSYLGKSPVEPSVLAAI